MGDRCSDRLGGLKIHVSGKSLSDICENRCGNLAAVSWNFGGLRFVYDDIADKRGIIRWHESGKRNHVSSINVATTLGIMFDGRTGFATYLVTWNSGFGGCAS